MIAMRLTPPLRLCVAASPAYLDAHGTPRRPEDLRGHRCIRFRLTTSGGLSRWAFRERDREYEMAVDGPLIVNDTSVQVAAALRGAGLIQTAEPLVLPDVEAGRLRIVLEEFSAVSPGLFLYYPSRTQVLPKLRAFVDHMRKATVGRGFLEGFKNPPSDAVVR